MRSLRRAVAAVAAVFLVGGLIGEADTAAASSETQMLSTCTKAVDWVSGTGGPNSWRVSLPASGGGSWDCIMGVGNQSEAVLALQFSIRLCHGIELTYDGIYGQQTADAVRHIQRLGDVPADGVYGPQTQAVIRWSWWHRLHGRTCGYLDV